MYGPYRMKRFRVKGIPGVETYLRLIGENSEGYVILITTINKAGIRESEEIISRHLFDACIRTGFLNECEEPAAACIA